MATKSESYTVVPTVLFYLAFGALAASVTVAPNGWLFTAGLVGVAVFGFFVALPALVSYLGMRLMFRQPQNYDTTLDFDDDGNFLKLKWTKR